MHIFSNVAYTLGVVLLGVLFGWVYAVLAVFYLGGSGRWFAALASGLMLDVVYGPAVGAAHLWILPFTLCAGAAVVARALILPYVRPRSPTRI